MSRLAFLAAIAVLITGCAATPPAPVPTTYVPSPYFSPSQEMADDDGDDEFIQICARKKTRVRVSNRPCDDAEPGHAWYFLPVDEHVPATGRKAKKGSFKRPDGITYRAPAKGGLGRAVMIEDEYVDYVEVCTLKRTRVRASDVNCDHGEKGYAWYYIRMDGYVPPIGKKAEEGSFFTVPYEDPYRARRKGGDAVDAAIGYKDAAAAQEEEEEEEEEEYCTSTINGQCVQTNRCTETVNGVCTRTEDGALSSTSKRCSNVFVGKRWTQRCGR
ncbi:hypothetical protein GCM10009850_048960 [Nonomuraea monospora]|uniref:Lipoprotein n=1 Tax=Nonomuraea monospora TaxID=568818 RepID=A0ABN3CJ32_9ACTN